jgi:hypothetical protein
MKMQPKSLTLNNVLTINVHFYIMSMMAFDINFNEEKNQLLKATRRVGFDEIIEAIGKGDLLADIIHPSASRPNQRLYVVKIKKYAYAVPYVINPQKNEIFLKTAWPDSDLTKKYIKGDNHEQ